MQSPYPPTLSLSIRALRDRLAEDLQVLYVREVSTITDYFVLATGTSAPHLRALAEEVDVARKQARLKMSRKVGKVDSGWEVLDFGDVVVHVMTPELREFYALEQLWSDAKKVDPDSIADPEPASAEVDS